MSITVNIEWKVLKMKIKRLSGRTFSFYMALPPIELSENYRNDSHCYF